MTRSRIVAVAVGMLTLGLGSTPLQAQSLSAEWQQSATDLATIKTYTYVLVVEPGTGAELRVPISSFNCTGTADPFQCVAPLPTTADRPGKPAVLEVSNSAGKAASLPVTIPGTPTPPPPDAKCVFPTGSAAISIFPTRMLGGGTRTTLQFQIASSGSPVNQIVIEGILNGQRVPLKIMGSPTSTTDLTDVGAMWFMRPSTGATSIYTVVIRVSNVAGCTTEVNTGFQFVGR